MRGAGEMLAHFRALVIMALCDVPPPPQSTTDKVEIIPICFNASEFSGNISLLINLAILLKIQSCMWRFTMISVP